MAVKGYEAPAERLAGSLTLNVEVQPVKENELDSEGIPVEELANAKESGSELQEGSHLGPERGGKGCASTDHPLVYATQRSETYLLIIRAWGRG